MSTAQSLGLVGNRNGVKDLPKPISDALRKYYLCDPKRKRLDALIGGLAKKANAGDVQAFREIADRIEGKVITQVSVSNTNLTIDADLLTEAGKLLTLIAGKHIVDSVTLQAVEVEIIEHDDTARVATDDGQE